MKNLIRPLFFTTILTLVGCAGSEAKGTSQHTVISPKVTGSSLTPELPPSSDGTVERESSDTKENETSGTLDTSVYLKLDTSEVSLLENTTVNIDYRVLSNNEDDYVIDVHSNDDDIISVEITSNKLVITANSVETETFVNLDVFVVGNSDLSTVTIPINVLPKTQFELTVAQEEINIDHFDTFYLPVNITYDGIGEVNLSIENIEGDKFASVILESPHSLNNNLVIHGKGEYESGTLSFKVVARVDDSEISVPVEVNVFPDIKIDIKLSNEAPTFSKNGSSFTIVRVCTDVSDDYEVEVTEIYGNDTVKASIEGSVISISADDVEQDTSATFMVTASLLGVQEVAYFDVFVTAD